MRTHGLYNGEKVFDIAMGDNANFPDIVDTDSESESAQHVAAVCSARSLRERRHGKFRANAP